MGALHLEPREDDRPLSYWVQQTNPKVRLAKGREMRLQPEPWNPDVSVYWDPFGQRVLSMAIAELKPGGKSTWHRQLNESSMLILSGSGYTIANGQKYVWGPGDVLQIPIFMWHQHVNPGNVPVRYIRHGTVPFFKYMGIYREERLEPPPEGRHDDRRHEQPLGEVRLVPRSHWEPSGGEKVYTEGHHATYAPDAGIPHHFGGGYGVTKLLPGRFSALHRHWNEAIIYIFEGRGYTTVNEERVYWEAGDMVCVPLLFWHRHNTLGDEPSLYLRHTNTPLPQHLGIFVHQRRPEFPEENIPQLKDDFTPF